MNRLLQRFLIIFVLPFVIFFVTKLRSQDFTYLTINPGIKSNAMGGAQTAIPDDYLSFYYNPVGLSKISQATLGYSNTTYTSFSKIHLYFGGAAAKVNNWAVGFAIYHLSNDNIASSLRETSYQVTAAKKVSKHIRFGASAKYLHVKSPGFTLPGVYILKFSSSAFTGDVGLLIENILPQLTFLNGDRKKGIKQNDDGRGLSFGFSILNTGPDKILQDLGNPGKPLPQMLKLGLGYKSIQTKHFSMVVAFDLTKILRRERSDGISDGFFKAWFTSWKENRFDYLNIGADIRFLNLLSVYLGYDKHFNPLLDKSYTFTYGFGLNA